MKKLLSIIAAMGLTSSTCFLTSACGVKQKVSTDDDVLATKLLIAEFIADVKVIVYNHLEEVRPNLIRQSDDNVSDFFTRANITTYGTDMNQPKKVPNLIGENQIKEMIESFNQLVDNASLKNKINKLATNSDKYQILINENKVVSDIFFDVTSFSMIYVDDEAFLSNASILLIVNYNYLDYNQTLVNGSVRNYINLGVTGDSSIKQGVSNLEENLATDLMNSDSELVWLTALSFGYQQADFYKFFEFYNDQKRNKKLSDLINSDTWQGRLNNFIAEKKYFSGESVLDVKIDFTSKDVKSDRVIAKINPIHHVSTPQTYKESLNLRTTILEEYQAKDDLKFISKISKGDQGIYDILNNSFASNYREFKNKSQNHLKNYLGKNLNKDNIFVGEIVVDGLALDFDKLNFVLPINAFSLTYALSLANDDFDIKTKSNLNQSLLGEAIYKNCVAGIESFQSNFGIESTSDKSPSSRFKNNASSKIEYLRVPLVFTGTRKISPLRVNIFDELKNYTSLLTGGVATWTNFNQILSLLTPNLAPVRYNLLNDGYQGDFSFSIKNIFRSVNLVFDKEVKIPDQNGFISLWKGNTSGVNNNNVYSSGGTRSFQTTAKKYISFNMGFELNLSLMSLYVSLPEFNHGLGNAISVNERTDYQYSFNYSILLYKK